MMKYLLNPIGVDDNIFTFFTSLRGIIVIVVFLILCGITVHMSKRDKDIKKLIPLIIADCLVLAFVIVVLTVFD